MRDWQDPVTMSYLLARCLEKQARWVGRKGLRVLMCLRLGAWWELGWVQKGLVYLHGSMFDCLNYLVHLNKISRSR